MIRKYESLKSIIAIIGENELSPGDRADYAKAKKLIKNFTQNMNVMEKHIGTPGESFTRDQTLDSIEAILLGEDNEDEDESASEKKQEAPAVEKEAPKEPAAAEPKVSTDKAAEKQAQAELEEAQKKKAEGKQGEEEVVEAGEGQKESVESEQKQDKKEEEPAPAN